jgi:hypothetical protein
MNFLDLMFSFNRTDGGRSHLGPKKDHWLTLDLLRSGMGIGTKLSYIERFYMRERGAKIE